MRAFVLALMVWVSVASPAASLAAEDLVSILIAYHSRTGNTEKMAEGVRRMKEAIS